MRAFTLPLLMALAGCAASEVGAPSLAPRAAETIDPRLPIEQTLVPGEASAALVGQLNALVAEAVAGDQAFGPVADHAERMASSAGAVQSESWIVAQQALSAAVAARAPVTRALSDIDSIGARQIQRLGGIGAADLAAIEAAAGRVAQIDSREAARIEGIQARLGG